MPHIKTADLGLNQEQVLASEISNNKNLAVLKNELRKIPQITYTATSRSLPGDDAPTSDYAVETDHKFVAKVVKQTGVDYDYLKLLDIEIVAGRNSSRNIRTDEEYGYIINEAATREFGWADPVGKRISRGDSIERKIIGVVKDFNYQSLHNKIDPLILWLSPNSGYLLARINGSANLSSTIQDIEQAWQKYYPGYPMEYHFLDESFQQQYRAEEKMLAIFSYFAVLTIVIACMGLFGLASFMAEQRTKEIGIRKVLGSSVSGIVVLLSRNFALLVLIAIVLAIPIAWYGMNKWLQDFAYRVELSWWMFALAGLAAVAIALLTVSYQAMKAAVADPVQSLRAQ